MSPRPFPFPLRVGTDICSISRLRKIITRSTDVKPLDSLSRFIARVLTDPERSYFWHRFGSPEEVLTRLDAVSQFLAGRFAAKEACRKACNHLDKTTRGFQQIVILPIKSSNQVGHRSSPPQGLVLDSVYEKAQEEVATPIKSDHVGVEGKSETSSSIHLNELEGQLCEISISHDGDFATAVAIVPSMINRQKGEHRPALVEQLPQNPLAQWDSLVAAANMNNISVETEVRIMQGIDKRLADLRRRNIIVDKIRQLIYMEKKTAERERILLAECSAEDRQQLGATYATSDLSTLWIDDSELPSICTVSSISSHEPNCIDEPENETDSDNHNLEDVLKPLDTSPYRYV